MSVKYIIRLSCSVCNIITTSERERERENRKIERMRSNKVGERNEGKKKKTLIELESRSVKTTYNQTSGN